MQNRVITQDTLVVWLLLFSFASCLAQVLEQSFVCVDSLGALLGFCKDGCKADSLSAVSFPGSSSSSCLARGLSVGVSSSGLTLCLHSMVTVWSYLCSSLGESLHLA